MEMIQLDRAAAAEAATANHADVRPSDARGREPVRGRRAGAACAAAARRSRDMVAKSTANATAGGGLTRSPATEAIAYDFLAKGGKHSPAVHHAGRLRRADRRPRHAGRRRRAHVAGFPDVGQPGGHVDRDVPQGVAGPRRHRGRRRLPLRRRDAAPPVRHADGDQRRRLPDRPRLSAGQPRAPRRSGRTSPPTFSISWPTPT